jgi:MOSC domain-containing protein YiiM
LGKTLRTGICKRPVAGPVCIDSLNVAGDAQANLKVHGGVDKAVYAFASESYAEWQARYPHLSMPWGFFGENLTTRGWWDDHVRIGNRYRVGTAELTVTLPRLPCSRLAWRFNDKGIVPAFLERQSTGGYLSVQVPGTAQAGDAIQLLWENAKGLTLSESVARCV